MFRWFTICGFWINLHNESCTIFRRWWQQREIYTFLKDFASLVNYENPCDEGLRHKIDFNHLIFHCNYHISIFNDAIDKLNDFRISLYFILWQLFIFHFANLCVNWWIKNSKIGNKVFQLAMHMTHKKLPCHTHQIFKSKLIVRVQCVMVILRLRIWSIIEPFLIFMLHR